MSSDEQGLMHSGPAPPAAPAPPAPPATAVGAGGGGGLPAPSPSPHGTHPLPPLSQAQVKPEFSQVQAKLEFNHMGRSASAQAHSLAEGARPATSAGAASRWHSAAPGVPGSGRLGGAPVPVMTRPDVALVGRPKTPPSGAVRRLNLGEQQQQQQQQEQEHDQQQVRHMEGYPRESWAAAQSYPSPSDAFVLAHPGTSLEKHAAGQHMNAMIGPEGMRSGIRHRASGQGAAPQGEPKRAGSSSIWGWQGVLGDRTVNSGRAGGAAGAAGAGGRGGGWGPGLGHQGGMAAEVESLSARLSAQALDRPSTGLVQPKLGGAGGGGGVGLVGSRPNVYSREKGQGDMCSGDEEQEEEEEEEEEEQFSSTSSSVLGRPYSDIRQQYELMEEIGEGSSSVVRVCMRRASGELLACKSIRKKWLQNFGECDDVRREVAALTNLRGYRHAVQLEAVFEDAAAVHIVTELCDGPDLRLRIQQLQFYVEAEAQQVTRSLAGLLHRCHSLGILHRDLRAENVLLLRNGDDSAIKVIDFGTAVFFKPGDTFSDIVGSPMSLAPEVLHESYGPEADVWSLGVLLFLMLSGTPPFQGDSDEALFQDILMRHPRMDAHPWPQISDGAKDLVRRMLTKEPAERATALQILRHPWLQC